MKGFTCTVYNGRKNSLAGIFFAAQAFSALAQALAVLAKCLWQGYIHVSYKYALVGRLDESKAVPWKGS